MVITPHLEWASGTFCKLGMDAGYYHVGNEVPTTLYHRRDKCGGSAMTPHQTNHRPLDTV